MNAFDTMKNCFCPECQEVGNQGRCTRIRWGEGTTMGWFPHFDAQGIYHNHDPNRYTVHLCCSLGHEWAEQCLKPCLNCDYGRSDTEFMD